MIPESGLGVEVGRTTSCILGTFTDCLTYHTRYRYKIVHSSFTGGATIVHLYTILFYIIITSVYQTYITYKYMYIILTSIIIIFTYFVPGL